MYGVKLSLQGLMKTALFWCGGRGILSPRGGGRVEFGPATYLVISF